LDTSANVQRTSAANAAGTTGSSLTASAVFKNRTTVAAGLRQNSDQRITVSAKEVSEPRRALLPIEPAACIPPAIKHELGG